MNDDPQGKWVALAGKKGREWMVVLLCCEVRLGKELPLVRVSLKYVLGVTTKKRLSEFIDVKDFVVLKSAFVLYKAHRCPQPSGSPLVFARYFSFLDM